MAIAIDPERGELVELADRRSGENMVVTSPSALPLWIVEFAEVANVLTPTNARSCVWKRLPGRENGIEIVWTQFPAPLDDARVEATARMEPNAALSRWHLRVSGLKGHSIQEVSFPCVPGLARQENERLAVPNWMGEEMDDPRQMLGKRGRVEWAYPGHMSMQCLAFYSKGGQGFYAACDDTASFRKSFVMFGDNSGAAGFEMKHLPELANPAASEWTMPYDALLGTFRGDWITAAEIYRGWATNQPWARESRLAKGLVPDWISQTGLWVWNRGRSPGVLTPAMALQERLHLPVSVFWHWWHGCAYDTGFPEYLPPREGTGPFTEALTAAHARDVHALVYMNQRLWGMTTKSWEAENAERWAVKRPDGKINPEVYNTFTHQPCASMCMGTDFWRNKYAGLAEQAVRDLCVDGIYMDQACTSLACYDSTHGHAPGGGAYWVNGFRTMSQDIRRRCARPGSGSRPIGLAGEGCGEAWLPYLDVMLSLQVSRERYAGPDGWKPIPFFHAVYHAFGITYGNYSSLTFPPYDDLWPAEFAPKEPLKLLDRKFSCQFLLEQARAFVWGQQPTVANFLPSHLHDREGEMEFVLRLASVRHSATNYLMYGTWARPPDIHAPEAALDMSRLSIYAGQRDSLKSFEQKHPLVLTGAWRAPSGSAAIALASISDEPVPLSFRVEEADYHVSPGRKIYRVDQDGRVEIGKVGRDSNVTITLRPRDAFLLEFERDRGRSRR